MSLMGLMAMGWDLYDVGLGILGNAMAISGLALFYALVWAELVCRPLAVIAEGVVGRLEDGE